MFTRFVILLGLVSLFSDATYEGARSITGQYLEILGASAFAVGFIGGLGEILGNTIRLVVGFIVDKMKKYWFFMFLGYGLNLLSVPILAFTKSWQQAGVLILLERLGKGIRTPVRDAFLSFSSKNIGRGWAFGLHEALDQIGAVIGPLIITFILYLKGSYKQSFLTLAIPASVAILVLILTNRLYPSPQEMEPLAKEIKKDRKLPKIFWLYTCFIIINIAGIIPFRLAGYYFKNIKLFNDEFIPFLFALAMATDAFAAIIVGKLYDRYKTSILIILPLFSLPVTICILSNNYIMGIIGILFWGITLALEESVMKAYIADIVSPSHRAFSYGIFNTILGLTKFLRNLLMGKLLDLHLLKVIIIGSIVLQLLSIAFFFKFIYTSQKK
jgi:predicted MFS family arabinose efflux permease